MPCSSPTELCPTLERACAEFLRRCNLKGLHPKITQTYRSAEYQKSLYNQGRTTAGKIVTNLDGYKSKSPHQYRIAFDICKNVKGQEYSDTGFFKACGAIWVSMGGIWGGNWTSFVDMPHFEFTDGKGYTPFKSGYVFPDNFEMPWERVAKSQKPKESEEMLSTMKVSVAGKQAEIPSILKDGKNYPELRALTEMLKVSVSYDLATKVVTLK